MFCLVGGERHREVVGERRRARTLQPELSPLSPSHLAGTGGDAVDARAPEPGSAAGRAPAAAPPAPSARLANWPRTHHSQPKRARRSHQGSTPAPPSHPARPAVCLDHDRSSSATTAAVVSHTPSNNRPFQFGHPILQSSDFLSLPWSGLNGSIRRLETSSALTYETGTARKSSGGTSSRLAYTR